MIFNISDYKDALLYEDSFKTLKHLQPVKDEEGEFVFSSGRNAVVFKMWDEMELKHKALKCYTSTTNERLEYVQQVADYLTAVISPYLVKFEFYDDELWVDNGMDEPSYQPVVLMDWVEGKTLGAHLLELIYRKDERAILRLALAFDQLALWLLHQPFAHGDLKHENILIQENGHLVLVDYDGCFVPGMEAKLSPELGTPGYQHPKRDVHFFNAHLDDFSIVVISLSLYTLSYAPHMWWQYYNGENILFTHSDFITPAESDCIEQLITFEQSSIATRLSIMQIALQSDRLQIMPGIKQILKNQNDAEIIRLRKDILPDLIPYRKGNKWGYVDRDLKIKITCIYEAAKPFSEGLAIIKKNGKSGFIDKNEREVEVAWNFSEGLPSSCKNGKWGLIDKKGMEVIPFQFEDAFDFSEGLARVIKNGKYGFIDKIGREVISFQFENAFDFSEGLTSVEKNGNWGFIDKNGREVIPCQFDCAYSFSEGLACVEKNGNWGFIDKIGREVISCQFDYTYSFSEGLACVEKNGKYGFIDKIGREVIPCQFNCADFFSNGLAYIRLNGKEGYIDKYGKQYWED
jgi:serine/threonine protein kinase